MSKITTELIKKLRDATGISIGECKRALEEAGGDMEKAIAILKKMGAAIAAKKAGRELGSGYIYAYLHGDGRIGAMVELKCETDFVAKNEIFKNLTKEIAMQIAATAPEDVKALLDSPSIKNPESNVQSMVEEATQKTGERIEIGRFARFELEK
ncbi:translation elongation factor Ts [Candidatus Nomurabacteria bacterium RIFCSPLOWO2_01_FULL_46_18]|uniref:Elongation factor Ts n=1 Tax=Candidatus Nomurabacteria bacterium RIFCSPLOWO2_01_FULL_46_18 TaxID=1801783 RepID=A0A1F6XD93_9BACT|nr:MAG: translation elongation factor Ts [Candidatus Nomurabacteria bacterium RIFCSPLOWO2_01_FULL_46_18]